MHWTHRAFLFLLFALAVSLIAISLTPLVREVTTNVLRIAKLNTAADYMNSA